MTFPSSSSTTNAHPFHPFFFPFFGFSPPAPTLDSAPLITSLLRPPPAPATGSDEPRMPELPLTYVIEDEEVRG